LLAFENGSCHSFYHAIKEKGLSRAYNCHAPDNSYEVLSNSSLGQVKNKRTTGIKRPVEYEKVISVFCLFLIEMQLLNSFVAKQC
jgi:hypothetical protein